MHLSVSKKEISYSKITSESWCMFQNCISNNIAGEIAKQEITSCPPGRYTRGLHCQTICQATSSSHATSRKPFSKRFFRSYWTVLVFCGWFWVVLLVVVGGFGWFWMVLDGFGWFWVVPCFSNYDCFSPWPTPFPVLKVFAKHKVGDGQHED